MPGGRPIKNGVDYFPLDVVLDDKLELIESEHGIQGFGVVIKLYQKIYADNYYIKWDKKALLVFSNRINVDINSINAIINSCMEWDIFSGKMYKKHEILTSTGIQKRFFEIVKRRKVVEVCKDFLLIKLEVNAYKNLINVDCNSQRKGKERKGKGKKEILLSDFDKFWNLYDKKIDHKKCLSKFLKLKQKDIDIIFKTLPDYIASTPDIKYRKSPSTYLNNDSWLNEIIKPKNNHTGFKEKDYGESTPKEEISWLKDS